jgi:methionyl-tRNA formyltransferase
MRILYFGDPAGGLALIDHGLTPVGVVHGRRGGVGTQTFYDAVKHLPRWRLPALDDQRMIDALAALKPDLVVASFYPQLIPQAVLDLAPGINVHPSALPRFRGPDPCGWTIRSGDTETAITVHWLTEGFDEGDVIQQWPVSVSSRETTGRLAKRLEAQGARRVADIALRIAQGLKVDSKPQTGTITWAPVVPDDQWEIDWSEDAMTIDRLVRAAQPEPGAYTGVGHELMVLLNARAVSARNFNILPFGTPYVDREYLHIKCGEGALQIRRVRLGRRILRGQELARLFV